MNIRGGKADHWLFWIKPSFIFFKFCIWELKKKLGKSWWQTGKTVVRLCDLIAIVASSSLQPSGCCTVRMEVSHSRNGEWLTWRWRWRCCSRVVGGVGVVISRRCFDVDAEPSCSGVDHIWGPPSRPCSERVTETNTAECVWLKSCEGASFLLCHV